MAKYLIYIRAKSIRGERYLYLVKSTWDSARRTSKQEIVKYLGKEEVVSINDIPEEYRDSPKITLFFTKSKYFGKNNMSKINSKFQENLRNFLENGNTEPAYSLYKSFSELYSDSKFFENIFYKIMDEIDNQWESEQISTATQLTCNNTACELIYRSPRIDFARMYAIWMDTFCL